MEQPLILCLDLRPTYLTYNLLLLAPAEGLGAFWNPSRSPSRSHEIENSPKSTHKKLLKFGHCQNKAPEEHFSTRRVLMLQISILCLFNENPKNCRKMPKFKQFFFMCVLPKERRQVGHLDMMVDM